MIRLSGGTSIVGDNSNRPPFNIRPYQTQPLSIPQHAIPSLSVHSPPISIASSPPPFPISSYLNILLISSEKASMSLVISGTPLSCTTPTIPFVSCLPIIESEGKNVWPDLRSRVSEYPGGLNLQHSVAYWLTLDLLSSNTQTAIRVYNSSEVDVIFVPFFSSVCFNRFSRLNPHQKTNRNKKLQAGGLPTVRCCKVSMNYIGSSGSAFAFQKRRFHIFIEPRLDTFLEIQMLISNST
ncbi:unnamed protein product [Lactuca saligna]|uniref:Uncharacterized protein n=1 Tax=Lactuca saligna TaxID=75948 RepID=A0AA36ES76_LACSI|nr:unnamed protein product [Lactuca saligna]